MSNLGVLTGWGAGRSLPKGLSAPNLGIARRTGRYLLNSLRPAPLVGLSSGARLKRYSA